MDDQEVKFPGAQAGQPGDASEGEQAQGKATAGLTDADVLRIAETVAERIARQQQSARDKLEARMRKEVQAQFDTFREAGLDLTDEQKRSIKSATERRIASESPLQEVSDMKPAQAKTGTPEQRNLMAELQSDLEAEHGVKVMKSDPEAQMVKTDGTAKEYLRSLEAALKAKADRLKQSPDGQQQAPQARMPLVGGGGGAGTSEADYIKEVQANRGKGFQAMNTIKEKYRKLGVNVDGVPLSKLTQ